MSFGSIFLAKEAKDIYKNLSAKPNKDKLAQMEVLLFAIKRFLSPDEFREATDLFLDGMSKSTDLDLLEQAKYFRFLMILEQEDKQYIRSIRRKWSRWIRKHKDTRKKLPPYSRKKSNRHLPYKN